MERKIRTEGYGPWAFREGHTVEELNRILDGWDYARNQVRSHQGLGCLAPMGSLRSWMEESKYKGDVFTMQ